MRTPRRRSRTAYAAGSALLAVAGLAVLTQHLSQPSAFPAAGGWAVGNSRIAVGRTTYIGMTDETSQSHGTIRIDSARAHVTDNSAHAVTVVYVCDISPTADDGAVGTEDWPTLRRDCAVLEPAAGAHLRLHADPVQQVVLGVTLTRPGSVSINGIDLDYHQGWRHGTQHTGGDIHLATPS